MNRERVIRSMAGLILLAGLFLGWSADWNPLFQHEYWLWLVAFVGVNLFQSGLTGFCPPDLLLRKLGVKGCCEQGQ
jgi:hypothetical protein